MKNAIVFFIVITGMTSVIHAQSGMTILAGTDFFIKAGNTVSVDGLVLQPSADFPITAPNDITRNTTLTHFSSNTAIRRSFTFSNTVNSFTGNITLYYEDGELNGIPEPALTLNIHNSTEWKHFTTGITRDATGNFVATGGIAYNLNELTLAAELQPLPSTWGPVTAYRKQTTVWVKWNTSQEYHVSHFEVERSPDGIHWIDVGRHEANNTPETHHYSFADVLAPSSELFYRIRETDLDDHTRWSPIAFVPATITVSNVILYPNPATNMVTLYSPATKKLQSFQLYNTDGTLIHTTAIGNESAYTIQVGHLPKGVYTIRVVLSDRSLVNRFFIKK